MHMVKPLELKTRCTRGWNHHASNPTFARTHGHKQRFQYPTRGLALAQHPPGWCRRLGDHSKCTCAHVGSLRLACMCSRPHAAAKRRMEVARSRRAHGPRGEARPLVPCRQCLDRPFQLLRAHLRETCDTQSVVQWGPNGRAREGGPQSQCWGRLVGARSAMSMSQGVRNLHCLRACSKGGRRTFRARRLVQQNCSAVEQRHDTAPTSQQSSKPRRP